MSLLVLFRQLFPLLNKVEEVFVGEGSVQMILVVVAGAAESTCLSSVLKFASLSSSTQPRSSQK